jgi:hypothetical protein
MNNSALSRLLTARAKALPAKALPVSAPASAPTAPVIAPKKSGFALPEPRGETTTTLNDGTVIRERYIRGKWVTKIY